MTSEALQNPYFVRLYCKNIDKTHFLTEPNDKIQFHGNYFFKKGGGDHFGKGGGTDPLFPPLNPPLHTMFNVTKIYIVFPHIMSSNISVPSVVNIAAWT